MSQEKKAATEAEARARRVGQAVQCMKRFFDGRPYYKPYPDPKNLGQMSTAIPQDVLISPTNVDILLMCIEFNEAMEMVQASVEKVRLAGGRFALSGDMTAEKESALYMEIVKEFRRLEIPYDYQGGMILLYLWLCEGVEFK